MRREAYPVFIIEDNGDYLVYVSDRDIYTQGADIVEAILMARDAIGLKGITMEDLKEKIPVASSIDKATKIVKQNEDIADFAKGAFTLVDVEFVAYRKTLNNKSVRRNVTLSNWFNNEADKSGLNVSKV